MNDEQQGGYVEAWQAAATVAMANAQKVIDQLRAENESLRAEVEALRAEVSSLRLSRSETATGVAS